eukprot:CAMPEP_0172480506 /NCGR_PEP_ID=MMETSP1066-20121228/5695_1 /TAXON_ID=671091 /ORGANISM="Coscinodiscus wailesii, Strain CCMP2513" /LENGTH=181 /DNA_ID=CAMNT_0013241883 /DNA_START=97 /DNA_END=642 /DNA_ORIENTATION=-
MPLSNPRVLQSVSNLPASLDRNNVSALKAKLEKSETENENLLRNLASITKALEDLKVVKEKVITTKTTTAVAPKTSVLLFTTMATSGRVPLRSLRFENIKRKTKNNPDAPKPAMSAYRFFCRDVLSSDSGADVRSDELRRIWKECTNELALKYIEMSNEDKKRFELENYAFMSRRTENVNC